MSEIVIDQRWAGDTGIGRLFKEVILRMPPSVNATYIDHPMNLGNPLSPLMLAKAIKQTSADCFYSPSFMPPLYSKTPFVITIHDLMHLYYYSTAHRLYFKHIIGRLARKAKQVITVSEYTKSELITHLGLKEQQITVIYNGIDPVFGRNEERYFMERPYFLYIGNRRKNKNIPVMIEAFAKADIPREVVLALSGREDKLLTDLIANYQLKDRVKFLGHIAEEELPKLYKGAIATLYVSLMEGFGLPLLESMASGTPVITSNVSALPEIAGQAALCVNPHRTHEIAEAIAQLFHYPRLRQQYIDAGYLRIKHFSWEETAKQTWKTILT